MTTEQANLAPTCVNHPKVETRLTCSSCGDPICTRCMVTTAVGQKCPRCARQSGRAKGDPDTTLLVSFASLLLAAGHGFLVGATVRWAARRRAHARLGLVAAAAVVVGLGGLVLLPGGNPLGARLLLAYAISGGIAYLRASGA